MKTLVQFTVFLIALTFGLGAQAAATPQRIALVIGNSAYENMPLANPVNDARLIAETLRELGFDVVEQIDADQKAMKIAIFDLGDRLEAAGKDAVGMFFYAGHGLQVGGQNYLVPIDAAITKERHVAIEAVSAEWVLGQMKFAGNAMNFVVLDACRNNPLTRSFRSATRGLAQMDAVRGSLVAYSTSPGGVAVDGEGVNSPYSAALARELKTPGLSVEQAFKRVRIAVMALTDDEQVPWESSSLTGDFYFAGGPDEAPPAPAPLVIASAEPAEPAETTPTAVRAAGPDAATERLFWESIKDSGNPAMFEAYLAQYPNGAFAGLADINLSASAERQHASREFTSGDVAESLIKHAESLFESGQTKAARKALSEFIERFPDHRNIPEAYYWLGDTFFQSQQYSRAVGILKEGFKRFPNSGVAAQSLVKIAMANVEGGKLKGACRAMKRVRNRIGQLPTEYKRALAHLRRQVNCN